MSSKTVAALALAALSTTLTNLAYLREHDADMSLPALSLRRLPHSVWLLLTSRSWRRGFELETSGFLLYAAALGLGSLALVQSIQAGGIGLLAYISAHVSHHRLDRRERAGVLLSVLGLAALAASLAGGSSASGTKGSTVAIVVWIGATALLAVLALGVGRRVLGTAVANGVAGGLLFSIGDFSTKITTQGGPRTAFVVTLIAGYGLGSALLQVGYQSGAALTVAGLATLLTNALPILAGTIVLHESVPSGALGGLRILAFAAVTAGALMLAQPETKMPAARSPASPSPAPG